MSRANSTWTEKSFAPNRLAFRDFLSYPIPLIGLSVQKPFKTILDESMKVNEMKVNEMKVNEMDKMDEKYLKPVLNLLSLSFLFRFYSNYPYFT